MKKKSLIGFRGEGKNLSQRTDENKNVNWGKNAIIVTSFLVFV